MDIPFRLGNHQFLVPGERAPLERLARHPRTPIQGATPPRYLATLAHDPGSGPAELLLDGEFCGHGEPTYTVFDLMSDGDPWFEVFVQKESTGDVNQILIRPSKASGDWIILYSEVWIAKGSVPNEPQKVPRSNRKPLATTTGQTHFRLVAGFEYPPDAESEDNVSWIAVAASSLDGSLFEIIGSGEVA